MSDRHTAAVVAQNANRATWLIGHGRCGLCTTRLVVLKLEIAGHALELAACGACCWHFRRIDGRLATLDDLKDLARGTSSELDGAAGIEWENEPPAPGPSAGQPPTHHRRIAEGRDRRAGRCR